MRQKTGTYSTYETLTNERRVLVVDNFEKMRYQDLESEKESQRERKVTSLWAVMNHFVGLLSAARPCSTT